MGRASNQTLANLCKAIFNKGEFRSEKVGVYVDGVHISTHGMLGPELWVGGNHIEADYSQVNLVSSVIELARSTKVTNIIENF